MTALPVDELIAPISDGQPCGPDLEYDADFIALEASARGKPERQAGDGDIVAAEPPLWPEVHAQALALARRSRDLRVGVLLARSGAHLGGLKAYADGLRLVAGLLEQHWDHVHPQLDAADDNDPTMRLNALAPLIAETAGLGDLRASAIGRPGSGLTTRLVELAWTKAEPLPGEARPTRAGVLDGLRAAAAADGETAAAMRAVRQAAMSIDVTTARHAGTTGPDLKGLHRIADALSDAADQLEGAASPATADAARADASGPSTVDATVGSRDDVLRTLDRVCDWIERHEPSNPAPLLIRRAQRLMSKSFIDLVRDLAPDGLSQVERIAGIADS